MHMLQKLIAAGGAVALAAGATPALAHYAHADTDVSLHADAHYDSDCLDMAVETHHDAKVDAYADYRASVAADLQARVDALAAANAIADDEDRDAAVKAAWTAYFNATADARADLKADIKAANDAFATAKADCVVAGDPDEDDGGGTDTGSGGLVKGWNGHDNGWHRGWMKNGKHNR